MYKIIHLQKYQLTKEIQKDKFSQGDWLVF